MKKTSLSAIALLGAAFWLGTAHAQTTTDSMDNGATNGALTSDTIEPTTEATATSSTNSNTMMTGMRDASLTTNESDWQFLVETAQDSAYDRATAELAVQKAQNKSVQRYALRLMDDHNRLNKSLLMQANKRGLILSPTLTSDDQSKLQMLMNTSAGQDFDTAYLQEAMKINAENVREGNAAIAASSDREFRGLMNDYIKTEQNHLDAASKALAELRKNSPALNSGLMNGTRATNNATPNTTPNAPTTPTTLNPMVE